MLALRAKAEAGWVLAHPAVLSGVFAFPIPNPAKPEPKFHRMDKGYVISTGGRDLVHLEFFESEDFSLRSK
uniref:Uncharacterized protein n=1 Tax=Candidatus Kentrum sp. LFY TaxID=2126342 RepID=A0A450V193_9GAMM|nr:MAG: hypothetical protein BECKLFY1418B_GA0070995_11236 [Candidatus Kentron sp. LFY]